jgi:thioredoxin 1
MKEIKTREDFDKELQAGEKFLLFYSPWCPFCSSFSPAFEKAAGKDAAFGKVSTDDLPELEDAFSVDVVPTVLFFRGGKLSKRLDGALGRGLSAGDLEAFITLCRAEAKR